MLLISHIMSVYREITISDSQITFMYGQMMLPRRPIMSFHHGIK